MISARNQQKSASFKLMELKTKIVFESRIK